VLRHDGVNRLPFNVGQNTGEISRRARDGVVGPPLQNGRAIIRIGSRLEDVSLLWFRIERVFGGVGYPPGAYISQVVVIASGSGGWGFIGSSLRLGAAGCA
jgi:hypothetical protein